MTLPSRATQFGMNVKTIGKAVRKRRLKIGLSRAELGARAKRSGQAVRLIELGRANPSLATLNRIALALGTTVETLASGVDGRRTARGEP